MRIDEAKENLNKPVIYRNPGLPPEYGTITGVRAEHIFVLYIGDHQAKATNPMLLELVF